MSSEQSTGFSASVCNAFTIADFVFRVDGPDSFSLDVGISVDT
jgi:hypothetical protein